MPKRGRSRSLARKGTSAAAAKRRRCQEDAQQRNSRLALPRLAHYLASIVMPSGFCHGSSSQSAVEGPLSKKRRSSEACQRRASLLVYNIILEKNKNFLENSKNVGMAQKGQKQEGMSR